MKKTISDPLVCQWNKGIVKKKVPSRHPGQVDIPVRQTTFYGQFLMGTSPVKWSVNWIKKVN